MSINISATAQKANCFTGILVSNEQMNAAQSELMTTGQKISSVRVGDALIGLTSLSGQGFFCLYSLDGLYLGMLRGVYDDEGNIAHWKLPSPGWYSKLAGTSLAQEAASLLIDFAEEDEHLARGGDEPEVMPKHYRKLDELKQKAQKLNLL